MQAFRFENPALAVDNSQIPIVVIPPKIKIKWRDVLLKTLLRSVRRFLSDQLRVSKGIEKLPRNLTRNVEIQKKVKDWVYEWIQEVSAKSEADEEGFSYVLSKLVAPKL